MGIWLIVTIWMLMTGVFVLAICSAAARPVPRPDRTHFEEPNRPNREIEMKTPHVNILHPVFWLAIVLAILPPPAPPTQIIRSPRTIIGR